MRAFRAHDSAAIREEAKVHDVNRTFIGDGAFHILAYSFRAKAQGGDTEPSKAQADALVKLLKELGADPNGLNSQKETALHVAARTFTCDSIITALMDAGANPNVKRGSAVTHSQSPLLLAIENGASSVARSLLKGGAQPDMKSGYRNALPLSAAAWSGNIHLVRLLLEYKAPIDARNDKGQTALHAAAMENKKSNAEVIRFLRSKGADVKIRDASGKTALDIARKKKFAQIVRALTVDPN